MRVGAVAVFWRPSYKTSWFIGKRLIDRNAKTPVFDIRLGRLLIRIHLH
jgi:hypothetical protein